LEGRLQVQGHEATRGAAAASWSRYWAAGHEHSCPTSFDGFYGPQLQAFWARQTRGLGAADTVLDLGCGNGALLRFLRAQFAPEQAPRLHGVDAAALRPGLQAESAGIVFHERTSFRALPLDAGSVALVASQFGIEYDNSDDAWREVLRVLRPAARIALVVHKRGSHLDAVAADELVIGRAALDSDVFGRAVALLPYVKRARSDADRAALAADPAAEAARTAFNAACDGLTGMADLLRHGGYAHDILGAVSEVLASVAAGATAGAWDRLEAFRQGVADHAQRVAALRDSALDDAGLARLRQRLLTAGFTLADAATLSESESEMGWIIEGQR
jgi:SAM-dependent methyltransferase